MTQPSGGRRWQVTDVTAAAGGATLISPGEPLAHGAAQDVYGADAANHLRLFTQNAAGPWQSVDLSTERAPSVVFDGTTVHVLVIDTIHHLRDFFRTAGSWHQYDLTAATGALAFSDPAALEYGGNSIQIATAGTNAHMLVFVESRIPGSNPTGAYDATALMGGTALMASDPSATT